MTRRTNPLHITEIHPSGHRWAIRFTGDQQAHKAFLVELSREPVDCARFLPDACGKRGAWVLSDITLFQYANRFDNFFPLYRAALAKKREGVGQRR